ncbi:ThiF family adenylyltransferase [Mesorhizobium denitrificans]|uniref:ThiF family adenylyltransferase n=1 Tax=Mesorhizobium denitrificans TaxID=2294114 RepID=UPI003CCA6F9A
MTNGLVRSIQECIGRWIASANVLAGMTVAIVGLGGVGSLIAEYLAWLGVGTIVLIDPDRIDPTNLPRVVGARRADIW